MANVPGLLSYLGFNVMGALSLLLVLLPTPGEGGGGVSECSGFPWDFHKTQPYQVYQDFSTRYDRPVKNAIGDLPIR